MMYIVLVMMDGHTITKEAALDKYKQMFQRTLVHKITEQPFNDSGLLVTTKSLSQGRHGRTDKFITYLFERTTLIHPPAPGTRREFSWL